MKTENLNVTRLAKEYQKRSDELTDELTDDEKENGYPLYFKRRLNQMKIETLNVTRLAKECRKRADELPDDGKEHGYPSTKGLLVFAAMAIEEWIIGDATEYIYMPLGVREKSNE